MNGHHWHLVLNHLPIFGTLLALLVLIAWWLEPGNAGLRRLSGVFLLLVGLSAIPVYMTGEPAEEAIEGEAVLGISHAVLEQHETLGLVALVAILILGICGIAAWILTEKKESLSRPLATVLIIVSLIVFGIGGVAANAGGKIRRPELRGETVGEDSLIRTFRAPGHLEDGHENED